LKTDNAPGMG